LRNYSYTEIGDETGLTKSKLGPKDRVTLEITVEISVGKNAMENLVLTSVENRGPIVKLPSKWASLWF
jgi:hypothetical protein